MFGKLENGVLKRLRLPIKTGTKDIYTSDPDVLLSFGYKEVVFADAPETDEEHYPSAVWTETERQIIQSWQIVAAETEAM